MMGGEVRAGVTTHYSLDAGRVGYFHMPKGSCSVNGTLLDEGDGMYLVGPESLEFTAASDGYMLLFDLTGE
jgi:hypothetical protein